MMQRLRHILAVASVLLMAFGCISVDREAYELMSELTISVSVSNTPGAPITKNAESKVAIMLETTLHLPMTEKRFRH